MGQYIPAFLVSICTDNQWHMQMFLKTSIELFLETNHFLGYIREHLFVGF